MSDKINLDEYDFSGIDEVDAMSEEEISSYDFTGLDDIEPQEPTMGDDLADLGQATAQGLVMGGLDELGGIAQAGMDAVADVFGDSVTDVDKKLAEQGFTGDLTTSRSELYREGQQESDKAYKELQERSPGLALGGEIGGGILGGILTAGLGTGGAVANTAKTVAQQGMKGVGKKLLTSGAKAAPIGGVAGALYSEGELIGGDTEDMMQVAEDTASGALMGAGMGAGFSALGQTVNKGSGLLKSSKDKLSDFAESSPYLRKMKASYKMGKEGINPRSEIEQGIKAGERVSERPLVQMESDKAVTLVDKIVNARDQLGKNIGAALEKPIKEGKIMDISSIVDDTLTGLKEAYRVMPDIVKNVKGKKLLERITQDTGKKGIVLKKEASVDELRSIMDDMDSFYNSLKKSRNRDSTQESLMRQIYAFRTKLSEKLKSEIPEYRIAAERFKEFNELVPETIISGSRPRGIKGTYYGDLSREQQKVGLYDNLMKMLTRTTEEATSSDPIKRSFNNMIEGLSEFEKRDAARIAANELDDIGFTTAKELQKEILETADMSDAMRGMKFSRPDTSAQGTSRGIVLGVAEGARGSGLSMANRAGLLNRPGSALSKVKDLGKAVYSLPNDTLYEVADTLANSQSKSLGKLGDTLRKGLDSGDQGKKNAALFILMQNEEFRGFLRGDDMED